MGLFLNAFVFVMTIGVIIFIHELGHFLLARWNKVDVLEFAVGFGPKLFSVKRGITSYSLRAIPFGGFVRMSGDDRILLSQLAKARKSQEAGESNEIGKATDADSEVGLPTDEEMILIVERPEGWFLSKGYFAKLGIVFAGPLFNILFAFVLALAGFAIFGRPVMDKGSIIGYVQLGQPADRGGLQAGDRVVSIDGTPITKWEEIWKMVRESGGKELEFVVSRGEDLSRSASPDSSTTTGELVVLKIKPEPDSVEVSELMGVPAKGHIIGIAPSIKYKSMSSKTIFSSSLIKVFGLSEMTVRSTWALFSGRLSRKQVGGPIMMFQEASRSAKRGGGSLIDFMIFINVTLAIFNLLPIPVLDGGHIVIFTIEALKGSALSLKTYQRVMATGMLLIMMLMTLALSNDLGRVFGGFVR